MRPVRTSHEEAGKATGLNDFQAFWPHWNAQRTEGPPNIRGGPFFVRLQTSRIPNLVQNRQRWIFKDEASHVDYKNIERGDGGDGD